MSQKATYSIRNWSKYNRAMVQRGSITFWFSEDSIKSWCEPKGKGVRGRPKIYSDQAILCALIIRAVFNLPLRNLQGFLISIVNMLGVGLPIPDYTRICRRAKTLGKILGRVSRRQPTDIVIDSTGMKIYGEGEWQVRQHGKGKRREWRKIHMASCPHTHEVVCVELTESNRADSDIGQDIIKKLPKRTERVYGDGAYSRSPCYNAARDTGIELIAPPQKNSIMRSLRKEPWMQSRNEAVATITALGNDKDARKLWKKLMGYHKRSLAETAFYRLKTIFGGSLRSREFDRQRVEAYAKAVALNKMTSLGMPDGRWVLA